MRRSIRKRDVPMACGRARRSCWKPTSSSKRKLKPTLEAVNASLDTVVKAQVYLRDQEDIPGFRQVWAQHFPVEPATTIIATATPGFIMPELPHRD